MCTRPFSLLAALLLAAILNAAVAPDPAWAVICQNAGAGGVTGTDGGNGNNTACGLNSTATGTGSNNSAYGNTSIATGDSSNNTAVGNSTNASGGTSSNTAIGGSADANGGASQNTALGNFTNASGATSQNVAIGSNADSHGDGSNNIAVGPSSDAEGDNSSNIATGEGAAAQGDNSNNTATGSSADASGTVSHNVATGDNANASGSGDIVTMSNPAANVATGFNANASGDQSNNIATGTSADANGGNSSNTATMRSPRPLKGRCREAFVMAGRGAAPAGSATRAKHSGCIGAPPGTTMSPCQELADDRRPFGVRPSSKAGPGADKSAANSMRYRPLAYLSAVFVALPAPGLLERMWRAGRRPRAARHDTILDCAFRRATPSSLASKDGETSCVAYSHRLEEGEA